MDLDSFLTSQLGCSIVTPDLDSGGSFGLQDSLCSPCLLLSNTPTITFMMSTQNDIYDDGDLTLIVGPEEVRFKVSRVAISLASPVWKAMVSGGFAESGSNEIKLPADQPDAMRIVLLQAYLQFARLPTQVSLKTAAGIAELCEKYDVLSLARDRFVEWVAALRADFFIQPSDELALAEWGRCWIWIGWVLRTYADFSMAILKVVQTVSPVVLATMGDLPPNCSGMKVHLK